MGADRGLRKRSRTGELGELGELGDRKAAHRNRGLRAGLQRTWVCLGLRLLLEWAEFGRECRRTSWVNKGSWREGMGTYKEEEGEEDEDINDYEKGQEGGVTVAASFGVLSNYRRRLDPPQEDDASVKHFRAFVNLIANGDTTADCTPSTPINLNNIQ